MAKSKTPPEQHEHNERKLRKAAGRVHDAVGDEELAEALSEFGYWRNEWHNSIPRDSRMTPVG